MAHVHIGDARDNNFGVDGGNNPQLFKSTEYNIDAYALFRMLARFSTRIYIWERAHGMWLPANQAILCRNYQELTER
ncbi:MAG TPA: hypothetical protein VFY40_20700 [Blastocatellia bacterium]|nr:hypothetical protein [Blastocatellia bacterium]